MQRSDLTFRRIKGRVIPIKLSKVKKEQIKGAGIAAAGAVVSVEGGNLYRKAANNAFKSALRAFKTQDALKKYKIGSQLSFDDLAKIKAAKEAIHRNALKSKWATRYAIGLHRFAPIVGASMIAYGTSKFLHNYAKDKKKDISPETASAIGLGVGSLGAGAAIKSKKLFKAGFNRQGAFKFYGKSIFDMGKRAFF